MLTQKTLAGFHFLKSFADRNAVFPYRLQGLIRIVFAKTRKMTRKKDEQATNLKCACD